MTDEEVIKYIRENFVYNPDGTFDRKDRRNSKGSLDKDGYLIIKIKKKQYKAHRLVYAFFNGKFPEQEIDHINRIRTDNRIDNLRAVTRIENVRNSYVPPNKETGVVGVHISNNTNKKYTIRLNKKICRFYTLEEAVMARKKYRGEA